MTKRSGFGFAAFALCASVACAQTFTEGPASGSFTSIVGSGGVIAATVSGCDDCSQSVTSPSVMWFGDSPRTAWTISSNGSIRPEAIAYGDCCSPIPVVLGGGATYPRIAIAQEDLFPSGGGDIYTRANGTSSWTVEWNNVQWFAGVGFLNAQTEVFANGDVEIRWGTASTGGNNMASGIEDDTRTTPEAFPVTIAPFGAGGVTTGGAWPTGLGRRFSTASAPTVPSASEWSLIAAGLMLLVAISVKVAAK